MLNRYISSSYSNNKVMVIYRINQFNMVLYIYIFTRHIYWRKKRGGGLVHP